MNIGLVKTDCEHDRGEWLGMKGYEEFWLCYSCAEIVSRYVECG